MKQYWAYKLVTYPDRQYVPNHSTNPYGAYKVILVEDYERETGRQEGDMLHVDDWIRDNDPRMRGRVLRILDVGETHVTAQGGSMRKVKIRKDRIHTDGVSRRSGFNLEIW